MIPSSKDTVYGECGKHPGNNMVNCSECEMEAPQPKIKFKKGALKAIRKAFKRLKDQEEQ